jgi:predicted O-methyltransferase YrrM
MNFVNLMPPDYYLTKIVSKFEDIDIKNIDYNTPIHERNIPVKGRLSLNHIELIEYFIRLIKPKNFLELGVQYGECTIKIVDLIPQNYYGVDVVKTQNIDYLLENKKNFSFFNSTTDNFFNYLKTHNQKLNLDMVFIDACHSHSASYADFLNVKEHLNDDGIIFFHDTYPASKYWTEEGLCNDCYKTSEVIRKKHNDEFEIITFPVNPGISIARKCKKQLNWL